MLSGESGVHLRDGGWRSRELRNACDDGLYLQAQRAWGDLYCCNGQFGGEVNASTNGKANRN